MTNEFTALLERHLPHPGQVMAQNDRAVMG